MITEDQNDYHEPFIDVDYIYVLKPDATPEYKPVHDTSASAPPMVFDEEEGSYQYHLLLDTNLMQGQSADGAGLTDEGPSENDDS
ncbi:Piso0_002048 [Millerozyma farinosa CBS 7064]|uniref:Piso0_002048 protein n=1 Tax=Pichia sorbitophila (strain ATCC MYA-4447 / BCRC 22081 / CBS 7064 / NBRC 10061 / NRRL Y-12695) TaxID=559304 RepID=G8YBJ6_PICSO|nr:Piso0_002048 [Millerozyma farinosa CBS 7064]